MAEEEKEAQAPAPAPKKSKMMLFVIIGVVVVLIAGGGTVFFLLSGKKEGTGEELEADVATEEELTPEGAQEEEPLEEGEEAIGAIFPLDTFVVNLSGGRYIRIQMQVEFVTRDVPARFYGRVVPIRDAIITALSKKTAEDILELQGREALRKEVRELINEILKREEVRRIYFTQVVVQ